jgi:hypothetical protein
LVSRIISALSSNVTQTGAAYTQGEMMSEPQILFYVPAGNGNEFSAQVHGVIQTIGQDAVCEVHQTLEALAGRLCGPGGRPDIVVILAASREHLGQVLSIRELLHGLRLILILPDREPDTITRGHTLAPRFLTYVDGDYTHIGAVLQRISSIVNGDGG